MNEADRLIQFAKSQGLSVNAFEMRAGLSNGYIKNMRHGLGREKLDTLLERFPNLSRKWLLTGEGDMLLPRTSQTANGNGNVQVAGNGNTLSTSAIDEIKAQLAKKDEQIERLLAIIDKLANG